jgi:hypothetical protein
MWAFTPNRPVLCRPDAADVYRRFAMSAGPLIWVLCSEIQPLKGRDFGITCSTATNWIANMIVGATFLTMLNRWAAPTPSGSTAV